MTDHYRAAREQIDRVETLNADLRDEYTERGGTRRDVIGHLNAEIGVALKLAGVHAVLAQVQAAYDAGVRL